MQLGLLGGDLSVYIVVAKTTHHGPYELQSILRMLGPCQARTVALYEGLVLWPKVRPYWPKVRPWLYLYSRGPVVGVPAIRARLFGVYLKAPDFRKLADIVPE